MRASVAAEAAGIPSVSLVCDGFDRQAAATARGLGYDGLPLARLRGHVDAQTTEAMLASLVEFTIDEIVDGLTKPIELVGDGGDQPTALDIVVRGSIDEVQRVFHNNGWTDGHSIVPPTRSRVEAYIAVTGHDPWRVVGLARPSGRDITVWSIAVNAVMAGCAPEHLPVLLAITDVLLDQQYGVEHSGNTTGADALIVLNGPVITDLGFNHGPGAMREGTHANASVGRWLRLFLRNVCDFTSDQHDKATFGHSAKGVLAEDEAALAEIGWPTIAQEFASAAGADAGAAGDAVTIGRINSDVLIGSVFGATPADIVPYLADGLVRVTGWDLTHVYGLSQGHYRPLLVLSPLLARTFARAGWSKHDVRQALFQHARIPAWKFEKLIGEWSNLTAGRRTLVDLAEAGLVPADFAESADPDRLVPIVTAADKFLIAVAGDPNRANAVAMSNDGQHGMWTSKPIDRSFSHDLLCEIPRR